MTRKVQHDPATGPPRWPMDRAHPGIPGNANWASLPLLSMVAVYLLYKVLPLDDSAGLDGKDADQRVLEQHLDCVQTADNVDVDLTLSPRPIPSAQVHPQPGLSARAPWGPVAPGHAMVNSKVIYAGWDLLNSASLLLGVQTDVDARHTHVSLPVWAPRACVVGQACLYTSARMASQ